MEYAEARSRALGDIAYTIRHEASSDEVRGLADQALKAMESEGLIVVDRTTIGHALAELGMTRCPYYMDSDNGTCETGCHQEPECQTCEPSEGWAGSAIKILEEVLEPEKEDHHG